MPRSICLKARWWARRRLRRKSQLLHHCPHIELKDLRGNVPTRIQKLRDGGYDAIMMACAGAERLGADLSKPRIVKMGPQGICSSSRPRGFGPSDTRRP